MELPEAGRGLKGAPPPPSEGWGKGCQKWNLQKGVFKEPPGWNLQTGVEGGNGRRGGGLTRRGGGGGGRMEGGGPERVGCDRAAKCEDEGAIEGGGGDLEGRELVERRGVRLGS